MDSQSELSKDKQDLKPLFPIQLKTQHKALKSRAKGYRTWALLTSLSAPSHPPHSVCPPQKSAFCAWNSTGSSMLPSLSTCTSVQCWHLCILQVPLKGQSLIEVVLDNAIKAVSPPAPSHSLHSLINRNYFSTHLLTCLCAISLVLEFNLSREQESGLSHF